MPLRKIASLIFLVLLPGSRAWADGLSLAPQSWPVGSAELRLAADAGGALSGPHQPGLDGAQVSGDLRLKPELRRDYDSGLSLGLAGTFTAADPLSRGRYDGDAIERLAAEARTGLGKVEIGLTDGAGYDLAVTGPKVDAGVSLEDPRTSFFRDPGTGRAVNTLFALRTAVGASSNYAKLVYTSPSLFGAQLALSFTPSEGKQLPFLNAGPQVPGRQADFWEAALKYETDVGPVSLSAYGAFAEGRAEHKLPGQEGVSDLGAGLRADYPVNDAITVSLGGSFRQSNAYAFDVNQAWQAATTRAAHVSAAVTDGDWIAGLEYGSGAAGAVAGLPRLGLNGAQVSLGYRVSSSIDVSGGWQRQSYARSNGAFFNGLPQLKMDAIYLHLNLHTSEQ
ncbi:MAG: Gram-negative porin [Alphaproteobacteria bacterium]|nr:Gram-negative porin [Alphaproteobacteria bacterium]MDB5739645.1 Gram-negative porin [Alphaproteobacteria bacterium]